MSQSNEPTQSSFNTEHRQCESLTVEKLWSEMGKDFNEGIQKFASMNNLDSNYLIALLIAESFNDSDIVISKGLFRSFPERTRKLGKQKLQDLKYLDILLWTHKSGLALLIALSSVLIFLAYWTSERVRQNTPAQLVVTRENGLPPFHKISSEDLKLAEKKKESNSFTDSNALIGRYTLTNVAKENTLTENNLLNYQLTAEMVGRSILMIPAKTDTISSSLKPGTKISLLFAGKQEDKESSAQVHSEILVNIILLAIEKQDGMTILTVAVTEENIGMIKKMLGNSELFVIQNS